MSSRANWGKPPEDISQADWARKQDEQAAAKAARQSALAVTAAAAPAAAAGGAAAAGRPEAAKMAMPQATSHLQGRSALSTHELATLEQFKAQFSDRWAKEILSMQMKLAASRLAALDKPAPPLTPEAELFEAVKANDIQRVKAALEKAKPSGELIWSVLNKHEMRELLIEAYNTPQNSAVYQAAKAGKAKELGEALSKKDVNVNFFFIHQGDHSVNTPLVAAVENGHNKCVEILLSNNANPYHGLNHCFRDGAADSIVSGCYPLNYAITNNQEQCAETLIRAMKIRDSVMSSVELSISIRQATFMKMTNVVKELLAMIPSAEVLIKARFHPPHYYKLLKLDSLAKKYDAEQDSQKKECFRLVKERHEQLSQTNTEGAAPA